MPQAAAAADCAETACKSRKDMFKTMANLAGGDRPRQKSEPEKPGITECPPYIEDLGRASWTLMHSLAAHYPDKPDLYAQEHARAFFRSMAALYPCSHCRADFQESVSADPPRVENRIELARWLCKQHNVVNGKLGKEQYPCDMRSLDRRWRNGGSACEEGGNSLNTGEGGANQ